MKCEKCGKHITTVKINKFQRDGGDAYFQVPIEEYKNSIAISFDTDQNWSGYNLTEEEQAETILCPCCGEFPFKDKEIQVVNRRTAYERVKVICFKEGIN